MLMTSRPINAGLPSCTELAALDLCTDSMSISLAAYNNEGQETEKVDIKPTESSKCHVTGAAYVTRLRFLRC